MFIIWWTGRGYLSFVVVLVTMVIGGIVLAAAGSRLPDGPIFWGPVLIVAAAANWIVGSKINRRTLAKLRPITLRQRLLYRARNRLMSLPMESVSIPLAFVGVGLFVTAAAG